MYKINTFVFKVDFKSKIEKGPTIIITFLNVIFSSKGVM